METPTYITFDDLKKVELKVGQVIKAEKVEKSDKLVRMEVSFGEQDTRVVLAGIAKTWDVDLLVDRQFVFVTNLAPRKMMGQESQAMILAAGDSAESLALVMMTGPVKNGSSLG